ncbi:DUF4241 domain-containing protein [Polyangium mundeleinium]|uniref:DUF4241 domain-containing protein n=1 Tax=Polyangium mundeleinium TaxID=2995306 RepID=A0ABT5EPP4_9BACT|nr:DUF4241 domain-containing protein [Polyangium mundeleinium]MDC0743810.1 DUF4241 domain-containing protein [Polyangium mundeleinium]
MNAPRYALPRSFLPIRNAHLAGKKAAGVKEVLPAGEIVITTGRLVACDPLMQPERPPFERLLAPGKYPVHLFVAKEGSVIGFAEIRLRKTAIDHFELATLAGQDATTLGEGRFFGYPVDAGLGCFADEAALRHLRNADAARQKAEGPSYGSYYDVVSPELRANGDRWVDHRPQGSTSENVMIFRSGDGDGTYATYFGLDADGEVACVVTSFNVFAEPISPERKLRDLTEVFAPFVTAIERDIGAFLQSKGFSGPNTAYKVKSDGGELDLTYTRDGLAFQVRTTALYQSVLDAHFRWTRGRATLDVGNEHTKAGVKLGLPSAFAVGNAAYTYATKIGASYGAHWDVLEPAVLGYLPIKAPKASKR